jgi:ATP-dependent DNA ligase
VPPPIEPMLARLVRDLPRADGLRYEPKWDGFRALAVRRDGEVELWSRHTRPLARYFPELVERIISLPFDHLIVDGEILVRGRDGAFDFAALLSRLHPAASRVQRLRNETPATFVAFDVIHVEEDDLRDTPFDERRRRLESVLDGTTDPIVLTPITDDPDLAERWLEGFAGGGIDGVVAKHAALRYVPAKRAMLKVKREHTAECVVAGYRWLESRPAIGSLLLGLFDGDGRLRHVGVVQLLHRDCTRRVPRRAVAARRPAPPASVGRRVPDRTKPARPAEGRRRAMDTRHGTRLGPDPARARRRGRVRPVRP